MKLLHLYRCTCKHNGWNKGPIESLMKKKTKLNMRWWKRRRRQNLSLRKWNKIKNNKSEKKKPITNSHAPCIRRCKRLKSYIKIVNKCALCMCIQRGRKNHKAKKNWLWVSRRQQQQQQRQCLRFTVQEQGWILKQLHYD